MEVHRPDMQSVIEVVTLQALESASPSSSQHESADRTSDGKDGASIAEEEDPTLERESESLPAAHGFTAVDMRGDGARTETLEQQQPSPDHGGGGDCCAKTSPERRGEGSGKPELLPSRDFERQVSKTNGTEQSLMELLQELREESDFVKKSSDRIYSESPYDTDCTKKLISTIQQSSSQEALLEEIESELIATDFSKEHKLPNGMRKGERALAMFDKCVQDKYLEQEQTIKK